MKRNIFLAFIVILLLGLQGATGQGEYTGQTQNYNLAPGYEMSAFAQAPITWQEFQNQTLKLNITINQLPDNISGITIDALQFFLYSTDLDDDGQQFDVKSQTPRLAIKEVGKQVQFNETFLPPVNVDSFFINVTILARSTGNLTQPDANGYSFRFPQGTTIFVSREDDIVPLINLYGFPPNSFFSKWFPVYGIFLALMSIPAWVFVGYKLRMRWSQKEEN